MHIFVILKLMSVMAIILAIAMTPCIFMAQYFNEPESLKAFTLSVMALLLPSLVFFTYAKNKNNVELSVRDGFFFVSLAWVSMSLFAATPFYLSGTFTSLADCIFEATSGITTTGATVMLDIEAGDNAILLWRSITHWIGGLGIIVLSVAFLPLLGIGGLQLFRAEASGINSEKMTPRIAQTAKILWVIYIVMTILCVISYLVAGLGMFDAVNHALSAMSTGGFSTKNLSIGHFNSIPVYWVTTVFLLLSGINYSIFFLVITGKFRSLVRNTELKFYFLIVLTASLVVALLNFTSGTITDKHESFTHGFFQVASLMTSAGFAGYDYLAWPASVQFILIVLMFIGGCAGSTAGGFKVVRVAVLFKQSVNELKHMIRPRGVFLLRLNGNVINKKMVYSVFGFLFLYLATVLFIAFCVSFSEDLITSITTGLAMVGNIGPAFGNIGALDNYAHLPDALKVLLSFGMLAGRLELYTFFVLFMPVFWRR